jgi:hypothetical protein
MSDRKLHGKPGPLACQGKSQKRLFVEIMSLLESSQRGLPVETLTRYRGTEPQQGNPVDLVPGHGMLPGRPHMLWLERPIRNWKHPAVSWHYLKFGYS